MTRSRQFKSISSSNAAKNGIGPRRRRHRPNLSERPPTATNLTASSSSGPWSTTPNVTTEGTPTTACCLENDKILMMQRKIIANQRQIIENQWAIIQSQQRQNENQLVLIESIRQANPADLGTCAEQQVAFPNERPMDTSAVASLASVVNLQAMVRVPSPTSQVRTEQRKDQQLGGVLSLSANPDERDTTNEAASSVNVVNRQAMARVPSAEQLDETPSEIIIDSLPVSHGHWPTLPSLSNLPTTATAVTLKVDNPYAEIFYQPRLDLFDEVDVQACDFGRLLGKKMCLDLAKGYVYWDDLLPRVVFILESKFGKNPPHTDITAFVKRLEDSFPVLREHNIYGYNKQHQRKLGILFLKKKRENRQYRPAPQAVVDALIGAEKDTNNSLE